MLELFCTTATTPTCCCLALNTSDELVHVLVSTRPAHEVPFNSEDSMKFIVVVVVVVR